MINAWYCVKSREVQSDTLHRQFSLWIDVGMVKTNNVHHAIEIQKKHIRGENQLPYSSFSFFFSSGVLYFLLIFYFVFYLILFDFINLTMLEYCI